MAQTAAGQGRGEGRSAGSGGANGGFTNLDRLVPVPPQLRLDRAVRTILVDPARTIRRVPRHTRQALPSRQTRPARQARPTTHQARPTRQARPVARQAPPRRGTPRRGRPPAAASPAPSPQPAAAPAPTERENEIVAAGLDDDAIATLAADGFTVLERATTALLGGEIVRLEVPAGTDIATAEAAVLATAPDAVVDANTVYVPGGEACEGLACLQLALVSWPAAARAPAAGSPAACGEGVTIGIVDTGINPAHDSLKAADVRLLPLLGREPVISRRTHGTAVAAVLVGSGDPRIQGLLPAARIVAVDAFEEDREGRTLSDAFRLVAALDVVAAEAPDVINLSLSGPANALLERAVAAVADGGIVLVAAVGNAGPASPPLYPAAYPEVIAATAVDADLRIYRRAVRGEHVDFAAPGVEVWTAASLRGARPQTGTSFAAPFVTAAVALAVERGASPRSQPSGTPHRISARPAATPCSASASSRHRGSAARPPAAPPSRRSPRKRARPRHRPPSAPPASSAPPVVPACGESAGGGTPGPAVRSAGKGSKSHVTGEQARYRSRPRPRGPRRGTHDRPAPRRDRRRDGA